MTRLWIALLATVLAFPASAQQRQPAQVTTLPASNPQEFDLLDASGAWMPFGYGDPATHTFSSWLKSNLDPRTYGAKCDGVTDDTTALQAWAGAATNNARMFVPGVCVFKGQLVFPPTVTGVSLIGDGRSGQLVYAGSSTTLDPIIQIGQRNPANGCAAVGWVIQGLQFTSTTVMTAGDGLRISGGCQMEISALTVGGSLGAANLNFYNAIHYDGGNAVHTRGFNFSSSGAALTINGDMNGVHFFTDPMFLQGLVSNSLIGIHICGGVGGFEADQTSVLLNGQNVLIDRTCNSKGNGQLFFGTAFASDTTDTTTYPAAPGIGVHVSDPGIPNNIIIYKGWLASATQQCFVFDAGTPDNPSFPPTVRFSGATIGNCHAPAGSHGTGIENQSTYSQISITGAKFFTSVSGTPTIYNVSGAPPVVIQSIVPDTNFNISGSWSGIYTNSIGQIVSIDPSTSNAASMVLNSGVNTQGYSIKFIGNGATTPSKWLRVQNGSFVISNDAATGIFTLTDAGVLRLVAQFTIAGLPTCNAQLQGGLASVVNAQASPPYLGAVSTTGSTVAPVFCNGSGWVYH